MAENRDDDEPTAPLPLPKGGTVPMQAVIRTDPDAEVDSHAAGVASTVAIPVVPDVIGRPVDVTKPSQLAMTECPACHVATPIARFCSECGTPLVLRRFCSECGGHLKQGAKFCDVCGVKVP